MKLKGGHWLTENLRGTRRKGGSGRGLSWAPSTLWSDSRVMEPGSTARGDRAMRWSVIGGLVGATLSLILFAPASWLAGSVNQATGGRLLLSDARGSIWSGSAMLVLTGGEGSHDSSALPGRLEWTTAWSGAALALRLRQDCCLNGVVTLRLQPGFGSAKATLASDQRGWVARWPAVWLSGLGTPWNTLQLDGSVHMSAEQLSIEWVLGRWRQSGQLAFDFLNLSSRVSTVEPLGSYRFSVSDDGVRAGVSKLQLSTQTGALILSGEGTLDGGMLHFRGLAKAAPGRETALDNLLNIIGRRQGAQSLISIG